MKTISSDLCTNWVEIDLEATRNNVRVLQRMTHRPVMAVVKANAYGHGLVEIAQAALEAGAAWCGVARVEEALVLRQAGVSAPVLVLGYTAPGRAAEAAAEKITLAVADFETARSYAGLAAAAGARLAVHAKIDSGMGRLGVLPEEGVEFVRALKQMDGLDVDGVFTHFARADEPRLPTTHRQLQAFQTVVDGLQASGLRPRLVHAANSAATLYFPEAYLDLVRPGVALHGMSPSKDAPVSADFCQPLTWKTRLGSVKCLPPGHGVGYGHRYTTAKSERVGVISVGYADGFRRRLGNFCLVAGRRTPVLGGVCMDQCMIALDDIPEAQVGDEVVLIGAQGEQRITADDLADAWGTINYEVTCGIAARVPRFYVG